MTRTVAPRPQSEGSLNYFDTHLAVWEEHTTDDFASTKAIYQKLLRFLRSRGWDVGLDKSVDRIIRADYHYGHKRGLEFHSNRGGRTCTFEFHQDVSPSVNKNGGRYDFEKFQLMPRELKARFLVEGGALLAEMRRITGYDLGGEQGQKFAWMPPNLGAVQAMRAVLAGPDHASDPVRSVRGRWDRKPIAPNGLPFAADCSGQSQHGVGIPCRDRDGLVIEPGSRKYHRHHDGRLWCGVVYPAMGGRWMLVAGGMVTWCNSCELHDYRGESLRRVSPSRKIRLGDQINAAGKVQDFERAALLRDILLRDAARASRAPHPRDPVPVAPAMPPKVAPSDAVAAR